MTTLTAEDEEQIALDIAERTVDAIESAEVRMGQARTRLDHLMLEILPSLTDEERVEMFRHTAHVVRYLRTIEAGEFDAAEKYWTAMQEITRDTRRPPYVALHLDEAKILAFTEVWVEDNLPDLDDEERAGAARVLLAPNMRHRTNARDRTRA